MSAASLPEWNQTECDFPRTSTVADLLMQQAARTPDAIAVVAKDCQLTYLELDERSNRMAQRLQALGVRPDTLVGVSMERTSTLIVSLLAILKAGCAYVPLDPDYPKDRITFVIEDSRMRVLLTTQHTRARLQDREDALTILDADELQMESGSAEPVLCGASASHLAYVIYTSGSTGKPKGVLIENRNVVNFFTGMDRAIGRTPGVWLAVTSMSFDISVLELLWTLARGFTVVLHGSEDFSSIADEIMSHHVTHLQMTPSLARILTLDARALAALSGLKQILLGGEAVPPALIHDLRRVFRGEIHNMYGPTETTIWSTSYHVGDIGSFVSIGKPIANTQIYILDTAFSPVPAGEIGELFIGGEGVARGYWHREDLTSERFMMFPALSSRPIYRTGDLARYLSDGNIEFIGRADYQIKLRGHRIEPGEIEALLEMSPSIHQAVVVLREDREGDKRLVAYLVSALKEAMDSASLRAALAASLPDYMVPSAFVFLPELPLTDNGKIDRKALLKLPPPQAAMTASRAAKHPANETENIIAQVWQHALGLPAIGLDDNFFDLGAHSLTVAEVQARLQEALGREITLLDLFQFTTVATLATHLAGSEFTASTSLSDRAQRRRMARQQQGVA